MPFVYIHLLRNLIKTSFKVESKKELATRGAAVGGALVAVGASLMMGLLLKR
jgi:hypothetical protein